MDFARPLDSNESIVTRSKIRYIPEADEVDDAKKDNNDKKEQTREGEDNQKIDDDEDDDQDAILDRMVLHAGNRAAIDLFLGSNQRPSRLSVELLESSKPLSSIIDETVRDNTAAAAAAATSISTRTNKRRPLLSYVDAALYTDRTTPVHTNIKEGDLVVVMESFDKLDFVYAKRGDVFYNKNGHFHHDDFIGVPFGSKLRSRNHQGYGFLYVLKPTVELWARSLNHRTQIVHELDSSMIVFQLNLRPNMVVVESGTGSGAMSHAILRTIAPRGHLHTYEFNASRVRTAQQEFDNNGVSHLVSVYHHDVCGKDAPPGTEGGGGFKPLRANTVDACFLDLPEPWLAVGHAAHVLKVGARIASYSPCVEQTQRTCRALSANHFHTIRTYEYRFQEHYVDKVEYEAPPYEKRPRLNVDNPDTKGKDGSTTDDNNKGSPTGKKKKDAIVGESSKATGAGKGIVTKDREDKNNEGSDPTTKKRTMIVARPFVMMRGHTAFLTFATAGVSPSSSSSTTTTT